MAVKSAFAMGIRRPVDMRADLGDYGSTKGDIWDEMAVHDVDMEPVRSLLHLVRTFLTESRKVRAENRWSDYGRGTHGGTDVVGIDSKQSSTVGTGSTGIRRIPMNWLTTGQQRSGGSSSRASMVVLEEVQMMLRKWTVLWSRH